MNRIVIAAVLTLALLTGCQPEKSEGTTAAQAGAQAGLRPDQYSGQAKGTQSIKGGDGSTTEFLTDENLQQYGVELYPGSTAKDGDAYRRTAEGSVTVFYTLVTSDPAPNVIKFYETNLKAKGTRSGDVGTIIAGKLGSNKSAVVTIIDEKDKGTRAEVQVIEGTR
jgi:hypothetical protein